MNAGTNQERAERDAPAAFLASKAAQAETKAANHAHTKGPWRIGRGGCVVSDNPVPGVGGSDDVAYYGGHMVAESVTAQNARRIVACVNACSGISTETLEACVSWADIVKTPISNRHHIPAEAAHIGAALDGESLEQGEGL